MGCAADRPPGGRVQVRGAGRVGAAVAATLSAAGVGRVDVVDGGQVEPWDTAPGGLPPASSAGSGGTRRRAGRCGSARPEAVAVVAEVPDGEAVYGWWCSHRATASTRTHPIPPQPRGSSQAGTPHLYGGVVEGTGVVGPLVLPGVSPCAGCLLRGRAEREPSWPLVVAQWRTRAAQSGVPACDSALATMVAGAAASYALSFLDGDGGCAAGYRHAVRAAASAAATPSSSSPHPECPCGAASATADRPVSAGVR